MGAFLGFLGAHLAEQARIVLAFVLALAATALALLMHVRFIPLPQRGRETPRAWVDKGWPTWALLTGSALGIGVTTRIGFWLWYAVPLAALLWASPALGATLYAAYGIARATGSVWAHARSQPAHRLVALQARVGPQATSLLAAFSVFSVVLLA